MSNQLYSSRSQPSLRTQAAISPRSHPPRPSPHSSSSRYPPTDEYGQRQPHHRSDPRQMYYTSESQHQPRSLRPVASSSRLPRQPISREEMPPPPIPTSRSRSQQDHPQTISYERSSMNRTQFYEDSRLHERQGGGGPISMKSGNSYGSPPREVRRQQSNGDHQVVLDRMRQNGWHSVGGGRDSTGDDGTSHRSHSSASSSGGQEDDMYRRSSSLSKVDSGYSDGEGEKTMGGRAFEGWSALKKAVVGLAGDGTVEGGQGAQIWNRLTTTLAASVGTAQTAWAGDDDGSVGPDGETKLGRAIKTYHLSRVENAEDVPEWLLNDAERARYSRRLAHPRSTEHFDRPSHHHESSRPVARQYHSEERFDHSRRNEIEVPRNQPFIDERLGPSRGSAADRLKRMREERRSRTVV